MGNKDIRPEWVPSAYRDDVKESDSTILKTPPVTTLLNKDKGIYSRRGFTRKRVK